jgi:hypothetical protein
MPASMSLQPLLLWHSSLCAATYACWVSGRRKDFGSMAQHLTVCLVMLALLLVEPQGHQTASIQAGAREAEPAGKQVKRRSGASGLDTPTRLVRQKSGASEGTLQGDVVGSIGQRVTQSPAVRKSRGGPDNALLPGCVSKEGKPDFLFLGDQDKSGSSGGSSRDGPRSPACCAEVHGTATQAPPALRGAPSRNGTSNGHAATADRVRAKKRAEQGDDDGSSCKVPRHMTGLTVRSFIDWCCPML